MNPRAQRITPALPRVARTPGRLPPPPPGAFRALLGAARPAPSRATEAQTSRPPLPPPRREPSRESRDLPEREEPPPPCPLVEPLDRVLWQLRPPVSPEPLQPAPPALLPPVDQLADRLLRRVALGGTRHRGAAFLEIGAGGLQGATVTIHAEGGCLSIEVDAPDNESTRLWRHQLQERLQARGLEAEILLG